MSVRALTDDAQGLLDEIKKLIKEGHITTWACSTNGNFTHTPTQWKNKVWLKPEVKDDRLRLKILKPKDGELTREVFAIYHGRFIEMLIKHVPKLFTSARATPNASKDEPDLKD
jgi:hypothetical protein